MLELAGKMKFDGSGFHRAMSGMKAAAGPAGSQIGQQIRGKMLEAFGAAGAIALFKNSIESAVKIKQGATKTGLDTSTFQALSIVADKAGSSVEELVKKIEEGGPEADALSDALKDAQAELTRTGQIIGEETVNKLANMGDKMDALLGKFAPLIAEVIDWLTRLYDKGQSYIDTAVAGGQILYGQLTGDKAHEQAGRDAARDFFQGTGQPEQSGTSAVRIAADAAARAVREDRDRSPNHAEKQAKKLETSSLVAAGAIFNGRASVVNRFQTIMQNEVQRIRALMERGGD